MKPAASPLSILDFAITSFEFKFLSPVDGAQTDVKKLFSDYNIDIDFGIHSNDIIHVYMRAKINCDEKDRQPGYYIDAEATCIFELNKEIEISREARNDIEGFSTMYIALNTLRGFISQITANAPWGRYILPSIDLNDLIEKKKQKASKITPPGKEKVKKKTSDKKK